MSVLCPRFKFHGVLPAWISETDLSLWSVGNWMPCPYMQKQYSWVCPHWSLISGADRLSIPHPRSTPGSHILAISGGRPGPAEQNWGSASNRCPGGQQTYPDSCKAQSREGPVGRVRSRTAMSWPWLGSGKSCPQTRHPLIWRRAPGSPW